MRIYILLLCSLFMVDRLPAQLDTFPRSFKKIDIFPAISYAPETNLTLGVIGYYYFDLAKRSTATRLSNAEFLAAYTLANQVVAELRWDVFSDDNAWRYRGEAFFNRYPDRNYGLGNKANILIAEIENDIADTLNYLRFDSDRIRFAPVVLKRAGKNLYIGLQGDLESLYRLRTIPKEFQVIQDDADALWVSPIKGTRVGLGLNMLYDSRNNIINPLSGTYIEFSNFFYQPFLGSDFTFSSFRLEGRQYLRVAKNHTLAMRGIANFRFSEDPIPLRGLSRVGGRNFMRGYFQGTYQDNHLLAFELEYRLPFWNEHLNAPWWKLWKRLGLVGFVGGSQVFHEPQDFQFNQFNLAAGGGLRILFNQASRLNIRIDYGVGLSKDSNGPSKRQTGLYFFLAEAF
ncbi:MAG: BamA/TamA family outer membrane protein [Lewinellaceae bacterium]|nr:BamA/TamA family outer membrane protein [Lewinellaceae bacterium]